jgi:hypothetical protein
MFCSNSLPNDGPLVAFLVWREVAQVEWSSLWQVLQASEPTYLPV